MVSSYSEIYQRLRLRYYTDSEGNNKELKLPFCETIDDISFNNNINLKKYKTDTNIFAITHMKRVERRSTMSLKGIIMDDADAVSDLNGIIEQADYKTLDEYITALKSLNPIINYIFDNIGGTMVIDEIVIDSHGKVRNYEIRGSRIC